MSTPTAPSVQYSGQEGQNEIGGVWVSENIQSEAKQKASKWESKTSEELKSYLQKRFILFSKTLINSLLCQLLLFILIPGKRRSWTLRELLREPLTVSYNMKQDEPVEQLCVNAQSAGWQVNPSKNSLSSDWFNMENRDNVTSEFTINKSFFLLELTIVLNEVLDLL